MKTKYCTHCGYRLTVPANFCPVCGSAIKTTQPQQSKKGARVKLRQAEQKTSSKQAPTSKNPKLENRNAKVSLLTTWHREWHDLKQRLIFHLQTTIYPIETVFLLVLVAAILQSTQLKHVLWIWILVQVPLVACVWAIGVILKNRPSFPINVLLLAVLILGFVALEILVTSETPLNIVKIINIVCQFLLIGILVLLTQLLLQFLHNHKGLIITIFLIAMAFCIIANSTFDIMAVSNLWVLSVIAQIGIDGLGLLIIRKISY